MPNSLVHYAVSAAAVHLVGLRDRDRSVASLWGVAPDLDVVTAIPWLLTASSLPLDAGALIDGAYLFGHRGLSHTFLAAGIAAILVLWRTASVRWGAAAGLAWATHVLTDGISPWPIEPFWPFSTTSLHAPMITGMDPLVTVLSALVVVALLGPLVVERIERVADRWQTRVSSFGSQWGSALILATVLAIGANGAALATTAAVQDVPLEDVRPAHFPRTATVVPGEDGWTITQRWLPWTEGETRLLPYVDDRTNRSLPQIGNLTVEQAVAVSACTLTGLGPYAPVGDQRAWVVEDTSQGLRVQGVDTVRNATTESGPRVQFTFEGANLTRVETVGEEGERSFLRVPIPGTVVRAAECGR